MNIPGITPIATTENAETTNRQAKPSNRRRRRESYSPDFNPFTTANTTGGRAALANTVEKCILPKLAAASDEKQLPDIPSATDKPNSFTQWSDMRGAISNSLEANDLEDFKEFEDSTCFASLAVNLSTGSLPSLGQPNIPAGGYRSFRGSPVKHSYTKHSPGIYRDVMGASLLIQTNQIADLQVDQKAGGKQAAHILVLQELLKLLHPEVPLRPPPSYLLLPLLKKNTITWN